MMFFKLISLAQYSFFYLHFAIRNKIILFKKNVMHHEPKSPNINLRTVVIFSEKFRGHEYRCSYNLTIQLLFNSKSKIAKLKYLMISFLLDKNVVWLDISVDNFFSSDKRKSSGELVYNL